VKEHSVPTRDGRTLRVREDGDPSGAPIFSLHGTPGSRLLYLPHVADALEHHVRLIGYDRPGYGGSTAQPDRRVAGVATDVAAIADALGIRRFGVWGHSGGGAPALACAARLPERVVAVASLAGVAPYDAPGLDHLAGMGEANVEDFKLMISDRAAWERKGDLEAEQMLHATPEELLAFLSTLLSDVDRSSLTPELGEFFTLQLREGLRNGAAGMRDDNLADYAPWGFAVSEIRVPVQIWHGGTDRFVGFPHGEWLAAHVPGAEAHLEPNGGHLTLYQQRIPAVHRWILEHF